ncbi:hypothetical protein WA026_006698 [Henosepilachna vigintioctopunctata]|uniref:Uncharacterized protein n=1 Tax=Henosepilachna vigintioctopunctata TaxID=420089 RepID=A0AAW1UHG7_9CUCU
MCSFFKPAVESDVILDALLQFDIYEENVLKKNKDSAKAKNMDANVNVENEIVSENEQESINESITEPLFTKKNILTFDITLSSEQWAQIRPIKKIYKDGRAGDPLKED